jgi:hypothetical protein
MCEPSIEIIRVKEGESRETTAYSWETPGTHDYKSRGFEIDQIIDRNGIEHDPRWDDEPIELFPGCVAFRDGGVRHLKVSSSACPVRVLRRYWHRYTGSEAAHNWSSETETWLHFEVEEEGQE